MEIGAEGSGTELTKKEKKLVLGRPGVEPDPPGVLEILGRRSQGKVSL